MVNAVLFKASIKFSRENWEVYERKEKSIIRVGILIGLFCVVGISYAIWQLTLKQTETNKMSTACFNVKLQNEKAPIQLEEVYPVTDEEGSNFNPYEFTITNNCNELAAIKSI